MSHRVTVTRNDITATQLCIKISYALPMGYRINGDMRSEITHLPQRPYPPGDNALKCHFWADIFTDMLYYPQFRSRCLQEVTYGLVEATSHATVWNGLFLQGVLWLTQNHKHEVKLWYTGNYDKMEHSVAMIKFSIVNTCTFYILFMAGTPTYVNMF